MAPGGAAEAAKGWSAAAGSGRSGGRPVTERTGADIVKQREG